MGDVGISKRRLTQWTSGADNMDGSKERGSSDWPSDVTHTPSCMLFQLDGFIYRSGDPVQPLSFSTACLTEVMELQDVLCSNVAEFKIGVLAQACSGQIAMTYSVTSPIRDSLWACIACFC